MSRFDPSAEPPAQAPQGPVWLRAGLRDAARFFGQPLSWALTGIAIIVTALAGPFGTFEYLGFLERLVYWGAANLGAAGLATTLSMIALQYCRARGIHWSIGALAAGVLSVPPVLALVAGLEMALAGPGGGTATQGVLGLLPYVAVPVIGVTLIVNALLIRFQTVHVAVEARPETASPTSGPVAHLRLVPSQPAPEPLLFQRIPAELGRDLVYLRAQDHYLEVTTTLGSATVLMRLGDAERDLAGIKGLRVHRSWWVALDHVALFSRADGGGVSLTTSTGHTIPVARTQREALRSALTRHQAAAE